MNPIVLLGLLLVVVSFGVRWRYKGQTVLRRKPGESAAEARTIALGTFRVYSWSLWTVLIATLLTIMSGGERLALPLWLNAILLLGWGTVLILAHAVYWRLGYDWRRWIFVAGHLTGVFCFAEYMWALRRDVEQVLEEERIRKWTT